MKLYGVHMEGSYAGGLTVFAADTKREARKLAETWLKVNQDCAWSDYHITRIKEFKPKANGFVDADLYAE